MTAVPQGLRIQKLGYSVNPWRLVTEDGNEIYTDQPFDHPYLGMTTIATPFSEETKAALVDRVLAELSRVLAENVNLRQELAILKQENA